VNPLVTRRERFHLARPFDVRWFNPKIELTRPDDVTDVRVTFCEMPRELAQGAAAGVGPKVVLNRR
jgi:hypothetical protein